MDCPRCDGLGKVMNHFVCEVCKGRGQTDDEGLASLWNRRQAKELRLDRQMRANAMSTARGFEADDRAADKAER